MHEYQASSIDDLSKKLRHGDIREKISSVYKKVFELGLVTRMRQENSYIGKKQGQKGRRNAEEMINDSSDVVYENAILFMQHVTIYRNLADAIQ